MHALLYHDVQSLKTTIGFETPLQTQRSTLVHNNRNICLSPDSATYRGGDITTALNVVVKRESGTLTDMSTRSPATQLQANNNMSKVAEQQSM